MLFARINVYSIENSMVTFVIEQMRKHRKLYIAVGAVIVLFVVLTGVYTNALADRGNILIPVYALAVVLYLALYSLLKNKKEGGVLRQPV